MAEDKKSADKKEESTSSSVDTSASLDAPSVTSFSEAVASRENFLRRLEQQQQKQQPITQSESSQDITEYNDGEVVVGGGGGGSGPGLGAIFDRISKMGAIDGTSPSPTADTDITAGDEGENVNIDGIIEGLKSAEKKAVVATVTVAARKEGGGDVQSDLTRGNLDVDLVNCNISSSTANTTSVNESNEDMSTVMQYLINHCNISEQHPQLSSMDWLQDVDPSSLVFLKGLAATVVNDSTRTSIASNNTASDSLNGGASGSVGFNSIGHDVVPSATHIDIDSNLKQGSKVNSASPPTAFTSTTANYTPNNTNNFATTNSDANNSDEASIQQQMLTMMQHQQIQMQQLQARLDALGGMMARMENDVRILLQSCGNGGGNGGVDGGNERIGVRGYGRLGGLFRRQEFGIPADVPLPPPPLPHPTGSSAIPPLAPNAPGPLQQPLQQQPVGGQDQQPILNRGIFFPLFLRLFQLIKSLYQSLKSALLSTGPGRIYAHIREEAIRRRAFANIDFASLMKLVVMVMVFSGRMGRNEGAGNGRGVRRRVQQGNNGGDGEDADGEEGVAAFVVGLVHVLVDFLHGHRVHTLVLASFIAFMMQVGLMSFFYQVMWVEREKLLRVWLGRQRENDDDGANDVDDTNNEGGNAEGAQLIANVGQADPRGVNNNADPANPNGGDGGALPIPARGVRNNVRQERGGDVPQPGGMIRRGPNNGGFIYDIQCLVISFVLSLIPAWRPEEAAPRRDAEHQREPAEDNDVEGRNGGEEVAAN